MFFHVLWHGLRIKRNERVALRNLPEFLMANPVWCQDMRRRVAAAQKPQDLLDLWGENIVHLKDIFWRMVSTVWRYSETVARLRRDLTELVGGTDANILLSGVCQETEQLVSLGPVAGLSEVARG